MLVLPLRKFVAPEFIYGSGATTLVEHFAQNIDVERILVVTDAVVRQLHWFNGILEPLMSAGYQCCIFDEVTENPKDYECEAGSKAYRSADSQMILAIGGGSVIDCAKAIGILVNNPSPITLYEGIDEIVNTIPPLVCIPTTAGSAADISQFAIIINSEEAYKMAIVSKNIVPDLALIDPALTLTKGFDLTIDSGLDVLSHAIESFVSNASSPITKLHAAEAIRLVLSSLPALSRDLENLELRDAMMRASLLAGLSFSNASLGLIHSISHALGGRYNFQHGELNGILLPAVCHFNEPMAVDEFREISMIFEQCLGVETARIDDQLKLFIDGIRPSKGLNDLGIDREAYGKLIPWILNDPCIVTNPRALTAESVMMIYEASK